MKPRLEMISGPLEGQTIELPTDDDTIVGNKRSADILLEHPGISWDHARLELRDGSIHIEDMNATNGTWVNGERLAEGSSRSLEHGDVLLFAGSVKARFLTLDPDAVAADDAGDESPAADGPDAPPPAGS